MVKDVVAYAKGYLEHTSALDAASVTSRGFLSTICNSFQFLPTLSRSAGGAVEFRKCIRVHLVCVATVLILGLGLGRDLF